MCTSILINTTTWRDHGWDDLPGSGESNSSIFSTTGMPIAILRESTISGIGFSVPIGASRRAGRLISKGHRKSGTTWHNLRQTQLRLARRGHAPADVCRLEPCATKWSLSRLLILDVAFIRRRSPAQRTKIVRDLIEKVVIEQQTITIRIRRSSLSGGAVVPSSSENPSDSSIEITAPIAFRRRGVEMRLVLPAAAMPNESSRCDPRLLKAIARGRAGFEELAAGRARSLRELAERDGIARRYVRRLGDLAFLSPELVEATLQARQPVELTATRLTGLDLPLDWTDQRRLLAN